MLCSAGICADDKECTKSSAMVLGFLRAQPSKAAWRRDGLEHSTAMASFGSVFLDGGTISGGKLMIESSGGAISRLRNVDESAKCEASVLDS